jgi:hypothetical protein
MTLQIGTFGAEGVAIVGDTWQYVNPQDRPWYGYHASKFRANAANTIAVACARDMTSSQKIADEILVTDFSDVFRRRDKISEIGFRVAASHASECLVVFARPQPSLLWFLCDDKGNGKCEQVLTAVGTGDAYNMAFYWMMRHYSISLTIEKQVRIGALSVLGAGKLNSGTIAGLEVLTCDQSGIRLWTQQENESLKSEIEKLETAIANLVFSDSKE